MGMFEPRQNPASSLFAGMQMGMQRAGQVQAAGQKFAIDKAAAERQAANDRQAQENRDRDYRLKVRKEINAALEGATPETWPQVSALIRQNPGVVDSEELARMREVYKLDENLMPIEGDPFAGFSPSVNASEYYAKADPHTALAVTGAITDMVGQLGPREFSDPVLLDQAHDQAIKVVQDAIGSSPTAGMWLNLFENKWSELVASHQSMGKAALDQATKIQNQRDKKLEIREDRIQRVMDLFEPNLKESISSGGILSPSRTGARVGAQNGPAYRTLNALTAHYVDKQENWNEQQISDAVRRDILQGVEAGVYGETLKAAVERPVMQIGQRIPQEDGTYLEATKDGWFLVNEKDGYAMPLDQGDPRIPNWGF